MSFQSAASYFAKWIDRRPIIPSRAIPELIKAEQLDVWLCSYGGSGTNLLADYLELKGFRIRTPSWHRLLAHHGRPLSQKTYGFRAIYLYGDPANALASMKRRGPLYDDNNHRKLRNRKRIYYSDRRMARAMMTQFSNWTGQNKTNMSILALKYESLFEEGKHALGRFLDIDVANFPQQRVRHSEVEPDDNGYFDCYRHELKRMQELEPAIVIPPAHTGPALPTETED